VPVSRYTGIKPYDKSELFCLGRWGVTAWGFWGQSRLSCVPTYGSSLLPLCLFGNTATVLSVRAWANLWAVLAATRSAKIRGGGGRPGGRPAEIISIIFVVWSVPKSYGSISCTGAGVSI
jgi:hypothetical protein